MLQMFEFPAGLHFKVRETTVFAGHAKNAA